MNQYIIQVFLILWLGLVNINAWAIVDVQLLLGVQKSSIKFSNDVKDICDNCQSNDIKAAIHVDPLPLIPVAFGLFLFNQNYDVSVYKKFYGIQLGPEVMAWMPIPFYNLKVYGKLGYSIYSAYQAKITYTILQQEQDISYYYKQQGMHMSAGLKWDPLLLIKGLVELNFYQNKLDYDKISPASLSDALQEIDSNYNVNADVSGYGIFVGVEVSI